MFSFTTDLIVEIRNLLDFKISNKINLFLKITVSFVYIKRCMSGFEATISRKGGVFLSTEYHLTSLYSHVLRVFIQIIMANREFYQHRPVTIQTPYLLKVI